MNYCRVCGCHDFEACVRVLDDGDVITCTWVEFDLCSFCALRAPSFDRIPVRGVDTVIPIGGLL